jgi:hypothetical protein
VTTNYARLAADRYGDVIALVERRGGRPPYDATVHVFNGRSAARLAAFEAPKLSHLRLAAIGDRIIVGDYMTGMLVGFGLNGGVAWGPISVRPETLDSLGPSLDAEHIYAKVTEPGVVRRVLCIDPRRGTFATEQTRVFSNLPFDVGKMLLAACWSDGIVIVSGWAEDASAPVDTARHNSGAMFGVAASPRVPRLLGLSATGGSMQLLWQREGHFADVAPLSGGGIIGLVSNHGIDEVARGGTRLFATSSLMRIDPMTGAELGRVDLGAALAETREASLFASGTRLVATDGSLRDTASGALVGRVG